MTPEQAERLAVQAFVWLSSDRAAVERFMAETGATPADLRKAVSESDFALAVLDFLLGDERLLRAFCKDAGLPPDRPLAARRALPGGAEIHWT